MEKRGAQVLHIKNSVNFNVFQIPRFFANKRGWGHATPWIRACDFLNNL
jgi:hypothetical protein